MSVVDPVKAKRIVAAIRRKTMAFQIMRNETVSLDAIYHIAGKNSLPLHMQNGVLSPEECTRRYARKVSDMRRRRKTSPPSIADVMLAGIAEEDTND